ncbi:MAG: hypothetical protein ACLQMF_03190 [Rectinemataceae bacterium]
MADSSFIFPEIVLIEPWVGTNYLNTDRRVMILGESAWFRPGVPKAELAKKYVVDIVSQKWEPKFFRAVAECYSSPKHWIETGNSPDDYALNRDLFWNDVAFYEYVQILQKDANTPRKPSHWEESKAAFMQVLEILRPDIVIAIGFATFDHRKRFIKPCCQKPPRARHSALEGANGATEKTRLLGRHYSGVA